MGGEFCPSGVDVNLEFDPTKKCSAGKLAVRLCAVFTFCADFAFTAICADLLGKQPFPNARAVAGCRAGRFYSRQDLLSGGQPGKSQLQKVATL